MCIHRETRRIWTVPLSLGVFSSQQLLLSLWIVVEVIRVRHASCATFSGEACIKRFTIIASWHVADLMANLPLNWVFDEMAWWFRPHKRVDRSLMALRSAQFVLIQRCWCYEGGEWDRSWLWCRRNRYCLLFHSMFCANIRNGSAALKPLKFPQLFLPGIEKWTLFGV